MLFFRYSLFLSMLFVSLCFAWTDTSACTFSKAKRFRARFDVSRQKVKVRWRAVVGASRYLLIIRDSDGELVYRKASRRSKRFLRRDLFNKSETYDLRLKVLGTRDCRASKFKNLSYVFTTKVPTSAVTATLETLNSGGRSGTYYLPKNYPLKSLPVVLLFHGSGINGLAMVREFRAYAREREFVIIAPDSNDPLGWEVGTSPGEQTIDYLHTLAVLEEALAIEDLTIDSNFFLAAGVSAGASSAAFIATNDIRFTAFAVMHGGAFISGFGLNQVPAWFSTGTQDQLRPPAELTSYVNTLKSQGYPNVEYHQYDSGHTLIPAEKEDMLSWWLD